MIPDKCPCGIGAVFVDSYTGKPLNAYTDGFAQFDMELLKVVIGDSRRQNIAEALAALTAARLRRSKLAERPLAFQVRSDSTTALAMLSKLALSSSTLTYLRAEQALLLEDAFGGLHWMHI